MNNSEFDNLCDRFDELWQSGSPIAIEDLVAGSDSIDQCELLRALLEIELEYRFKADDEPNEEEYQARFPQQHEIIAKAFAATRHRLQESREEGTIKSNSALPDLNASLGSESSQVGPYRILKPIGQGGMGQVFLAEQTTPIHRQVALKIIKSETPTREILSRFDAERQALAMMDHPNIAKVLDAGMTSSGRPYFAMELVRGIPITEYCDENKLSPDERLNLFVQTCRAIQHAHNKGIVHRDIKPSNILVTRLEGKPTAKVIDFGLAKAVNGTNQLTDQTLSTQFGQVLGTLAYMSPEQAEINSQDVDTRTDVYSLGVVFYELLTGSPPITRQKLKSEAFDRILAIIREEEAPRPSLRLSDLGDAISGISEQRRTSPKSLNLILRGDLDWIAVKALEKDRGRRYDTPSALANDIQRYLNNEAVEARPPSFTYQLQKSFRKHRSRYIVAGTILGLLIAGLAGTATMWIRAASAETRAKSETKKANEARADAERERDRADDQAEKAKNAAKTADQQANRARDTAAAATFQLANARWEAARVGEALRLLHEIPPPYRNNFEWNLSYRQFQGSNVTFFGHLERVNSISFSPDGTKIVSGSDDAMVKVWDATTGKTLNTLAGHHGKILNVQFSPDGSKIASASSDATIRIWNCRTGKLQLTLEGHESAVNCIAFSPDGMKIATASKDALIRVWDEANGKLHSILQKHIGSVNCVAFSPDGLRIASGGRDKTVRVWSAQNGEEIRKLRGHNGVVTDVSFCPNGSTIASSSSDQSIRLWDTDSLQLIRKLEGKEFTIRSVRFSPDGATIASAAVDNSITLWDVDSGSEIRNLKGHSGIVTSIAFSPDGSRIVSGSDDNTIKLWNHSAGYANMSLKGHSGVVSSLSFCRDGSTFATAGMDGAVRMWDAETGRLRQAMHPTVAGGPLNGVSASPDGSEVVFGGADKVVRIWNLESDQLSLFEGHQEIINSVAFSPDGSTIASASSDKTVRLWDTGTGQLRYKLTGRDRQMSVAFSPDGSKVIAGDWNGLVQVWNAESGEKIGKAIATGGSRIWNIAFTSDGKKMALGCADRTIKLFDRARLGEAPSLGNFRTLRGHASSVTSVAFNRDGSRIVSSSYDSKLKLWDTGSGKELKSFGDQDKPILCAAFSPDGSKIVSVGYGGAVELWNGDKNHEIKTLIGHSRNVSNASFSADGRRLYSRAGKEKLVWSTESGKILTDAKWRDIPLRRRHGRWLIVTSDDRILLVDFEFKNTPWESARRKLQSVSKPWWHNERYRIAVRKEDWYAASFHGAWLLTLNSNSRTAYENFHRVYAKLDPQMAKVTATVVKQALAIPMPPN